MKQLLMDGAAWKHADDVYASFFLAVGAPPHHGRNFNALRDSIKNGGMNNVETPYCLVIQNFDCIGDGARSMAANFIEMINELGSEGVPIRIRTENAKH